MDEGLKKELSISSSQNLDSRSQMKDWNSICWMCFYCGEDFKDFAQLKAHQESFHDVVSWADADFECCDCNAGLSGYSNFLNHVRTKHYEALKLCCDICNRILPNYEKLSSHRDKHNEIDIDIHPAIYHCTQCGKVHLSENLLKQHLQKVHCFISEDKDQKNEECFLDSVQHGDVSYEILEYLGDDSKVAESMNYEDKYTEVNQIFQCGQCDQNFDSESGLSFHNCGSCDNKCNICGMKYLKERHLRNHMRVHANQESYKCSYCSKDFKYNYNLKAHIITHLDMHPFKCGVCSKEFVLKRQLESHVITHSTVRPFKCKICTMEFKRKNILQNHMLIHTNERRFRCDICLKAFRLKHHLKKHKVTHSNERLFRCGSCPRQYKSNRDLKQHMKSHINEPNFNCDNCFKKFPSKQNFVTHKKVCVGSAAVAD